MDLKITGRITKIKDVQTGEKKDGSGTWSKQEFLVETDAEYNNLYCFDVFGDEKVANLTKFNKVGDTVEVSFNVNTREYNDRHYTNLSAWRIETSQVEKEEKAVENDAFPF